VEILSSTEEDVSISRDRLIERENYDRKAKVIIRVLLQTLPILKDFWSFLLLTELVPRTRVFAKPILASVSGLPKSFPISERGPRSHVSCRFTMRPLTS